MRFIYTKTFVRIFVLFVAIALFIILDATGVSATIKNGFLKTYGRGSAHVAAISSSVRDFFATIFAIKNLAYENALLNQKINELAFENARLQSAKQENAALRRALNFQENSQFDLIPAKVLTADPTGFSQTVTIDKGYADLVKENSAVILAPGLLVGKVTKVFSGSSEVTLITAPDVVVSAEVAESQAKGLVHGEHGLSLLFDLVTQNELIKPQDKIITSGLANDFPRGLLIGEVVSIQSASSDLFQKAFITPAADLRNLKFLFVLK